MACGGHGKNDCIPSLTVLILRQVSSKVERAFTQLPTALLQLIAIMGGRAIFPVDTDKEKDGVSGIRMMESSRRGVEGRMCGRLNLR